MKAEHTLVGGSHGKPVVAHGNDDRPRPATIGRLRERATAVPATLWLTAIVVVSTVELVAFGRSISAPWIVPDEIFYSEMARSFAATGHFAVRDVPMIPFGVVYPLLIAPAYALFEDLPRAYGAAKAVNALLISSAAVPAFFLARRVLRPGFAGLAAAL